MILNKVLYIRVSIGVVVAKKSGEKKDWKALLKESKHLEKEKLLSREEFLRIKKESFDEAVKLRKMLGKQWFVRDTDIEKVKARKK